MSTQFCLSTTSHFSHFILLPVQVFHRVVMRHSSSNVMWTFCFVNTILSRRSSWHAEFTLSYGTTCSPKRYFNWCFAKSNTCVTVAIFCGNLFGFRLRSLQWGIPGVWSQITAIKQKPGAEDSIIFILISDCGSIVSLLKVNKARS